MAGNLQQSGRKKRRRRGMSEINVTPFVDVMLVLLIVFMISAPLLTTGVNVDLPKANSSAISGQDEPLVISVTLDGAIYIQESLVTPDALEAMLAAITQRNQDARIFVRGDQGANYGNVMAVIAAIHRAGYRRVSLVTNSNSRL